MADLGRLEKCELRNVWESEASDFTPWLAQEDNLAILGETLSLDLELEAQERSVGPFRADILCKDVGSDEWVLIENQLERTDHTHLGQLLTYASGLEAVTIIWIAARFTEEHRSTLDWLNRITDQSFRFFGVEIELWRIGASLAAPKFNVVSKPNDWSRAVVRSARSIDEAQLSETRLMQRDYWVALNETLERLKGPVSGARKAQPRSWITYPIGRTSFWLAAAMIRPQSTVRIELYIAGDDAKGFFRALFGRREEIEANLGYALDWQELPERRDCRVCANLRDIDPEARSAWQFQHEWLAQKLFDFDRVFRPIVRDLEPVDDIEEDEREQA